ncbi:Putative PAS domain, phytochrome, signal transduction response regulator, receiver [Colletotrichum destructivum]|uniref:PAS domain, phytochrome, signal transduction response regulator, receiver n=1 Tax=Colletotrichum destructivum TaxID=34406 RepID=A0AAX4ISK0_9PEZI|nr:Putative PAS domain, phytochrome, signal transduction response regulator, receiver [Colletotrichum destructivum]
MDAQSDIRRPSVSFADRSSTGESSEATPVASVHSNPIAPQLPNPSAAATPSCSSSWSANSDRQLGHGASPDPTDRVFPIRSVVSVDRTGRTSGEHDYFPRVPDHGQYQAPRPGNPRIDTAAFEAVPRRDSASTLLSNVTSPSDRQGIQTRRKIVGSGPISSVQADAVRHASSQPLDIFQDVASEGEDDSAQGDDSSQHQTSVSTGALGEAGSDVLLTTRLKYVMTDEGHHVITGTDGVLQRCEDEPIHTPGAVQGFGALVAVREETDGRFSVRYASENTQRLMGYSPQHLFRLNSFLDILSEEQQDNLLDHIDFIRDEDADPAVNGPEVFSLSIRPPNKKSVKLWCAIHINPAHPDLVICEFEVDDDHQFPLRPPDEVTPLAPEDTLQSNPTSEELVESTEILSKPLRVLRSARKRRGDAGAMQVFDIMSQVQEQLAGALNLESFLKILVGIVKELTGFHRVMIYQFDSSFNGKVVTELVDTTQTKDLYKGLHFPASDIPRQARELYRLNKVRLLYDRDLDTARLVCKTKEDLDVPLDLSHSYLRAMSPIHLKYLKNMAVRSSMSVSINAFNELWGLIACHSYGRKGMRVSFPIRKMCRLVGDTASRNIERLSYATRLQARKLINTAPTEKNPSGYIIASSDDLLKLFDADFGMLSIKGETKILGDVEQSQEALAMLEYLRLRELTSVVTSQDIREDFPDLRYSLGFTVIAGLLYVPLSVGGHDFIVFFRKGQVKEVKWAGNPYEKTLREGTAAYLEPRKSFKTWHETVLGKCRDWSEEQVETAAVLCLVYGKFIEVWRQKEAALQSSRLTRLLLANSAHEVRTPLNAIINYLEIALEGSLDQETRDNLAKSHSASKSLIYVINDLLDLTKTEEGQNLIKDEVFDFGMCIREATDPFTNDAKRKGIEYQVIEHPGLPQHVCGDSRRLRQAISNVAANAVQNTSTGSVKVELYVSNVLDRRIRIEIVVEDTGKGMTARQLDTLFRDLEQVNVEMDEDSFISSTDSDHGKDTRVLGLGLAVVARIVRNMDGQLRLKSEQGKGSRFVIQLPFDLPEDAPAPVEGGQKSAKSNTASSVASVTTAIMPDPDGEMMLIDRGSKLPVVNEAGTDGGCAETQSLESQKTAATGGSKSSGRSDAERLIDAIKNPLTIGEIDPSRPSAHRQYSREHIDRPTMSKSNGASSSSASRQVQPPVSRRFNQNSSDLSTVELPHSPEIGYTSVTDIKTPIRAIRVPDEYSDQPPRPQASDSSRVLFEVHDGSKALGTSDAGTAGTAPSAVSAFEDTKLQVLIAEDDPINSRILRKRLEKSGHQVSHAVNGEDCATVYRENSKSFDVVLMDMQMPIVDGLTSTKMIRAFERSIEHGGHSPIASHNGRTPIFAVSASLIERERDKYMDAGFDGWILKPIDFKRLNTLLLGIVEDDVRATCLYAPGKWEYGGWFNIRETKDKDGSDETTPAIEETPKETTHPTPETDEPN